MRSTRDIRICNVCGRLLDIGESCNCEQPIRGAPRDGLRAKDEDGKITRGTWHEIKIVPDSLTRIEANLFVQTFVQSVGGGDY